MSWWYQLFGKTPYNPGNKGGEELPVSFSTVPIEGYRTWRIRGEGDDMALYSLIQSHRWDVEDTAECFPRGQHVEPAPGKRCVCGFYAQLPDHPFDEWLSHVNGRVHATGQIAMSGRVVVCERGFKAQHVRILSPVFVDVSCADPGCDRRVTRIRLPLKSKDFWGQCDTHDPPDGSRVVVDAKEWMGDALNLLSAKYPGIEFLTFQEV